MKEIKLTKGKTALVDDCDYDFLNQWKWFVWTNNKGKYYAKRSYRYKGKQIFIFMHRLIMNTPEKMVTDHIDNNGLNNQRKNLRICNRSQNEINKPKNKNKTSNYFGVSKLKNGKYRSQIGLNGKIYVIGDFNSEVEAAKRYNNKSIELHGEFAKINII